MPASFPDQRSGRILLVAHRILSTSISGKRRDDGKPAITAVTRWASETGAGLYQLPLPSHLLGRKDPARDASRIEFVLSQLDVYRGGGYQLLGALAIAEDLDEAAERDWWTLFVETSAAHGWEDLPLGQISLDADNATDIQFEAPQQAAS